MAKKPIRRPTWPDGSSDRVKGHVNELEKNLRTIAQACARHDSSEVVLEKHVDHALESMGRLGLKRKPLWKRSETELTLGSFLFGLSFALPDLMSFLADPSSAAAPWRTAAVLTALFVGAILVCHAWVRTTVAD